MRRQLSISKMTQFFSMASIVSIVLVCFFVNNQISLLIGTFLLGVYAAAGLVRQSLKWSEVVFISVFSFAMVPVFASFNHGLNIIFYYLSTVFSFLAARYMATADDTVLLRVFRFVFGAFFLVCLFLYYIHREEVEPFGAILEGSSTNGIPSYFIVLQVTVSMVVYLVIGRLPLFSSMCTLVIAILGIGRGSILAAIIILVVTVGFNFFHDIGRNRWGRAGALLGLIFVVVSIGLVNYDILYSYLSAKTNLSRGLYDPARAAMINDYLGQLSVTSFFTGSGFEGTIISERFGNNPHNSFIRAHSYLGLGGGIDGCTIATSNICCAG